ncbi:unnamed protein product [Microthlaspi erraticum]|uniref:Pentacotripeptide-repeat region of PRORP domain-containing protein n=1 Tax=Microthlaspi erraticum TaxID=1685480 RepID=A0A6D2KY61_9BRAS|nr:unnamed protein product [Microthlaspi erraticum]
MEKKGIRPDVVHLHSLISCLCNYGRWEDAAGLLSDMIEKKINPDVVTFNALIDGFVKEGKLLEAENSKDCLPNVVTYTTLINGFCKSKRVEDGMELFREMSQRGLVGNTVTYTLLSKGFSKLEIVRVPNKFSNRWFLWCASQYLDIQHFVRWALVVQGWEGGRCVEVFCSLDLKGVKPDGYLRDGDKAASAELINEMKSCGFAADASPLAWSLICCLMGD